MNTRLLRAFIDEIINEYWGEPAGTVLRNQNTVLAKKIADKSKLDFDPLQLDSDDGVIVPKDVRHKIKKFFNDMKLLPNNDKKEKSYK